MDHHQLLLERQQRVLDTMQGLKTDRPPLLFSGDCALIRYVNPEITFLQMIEDHETLMNTIATDCLPRFPKIDLLMGMSANSRNKGARNMAKTYLPGKELKENEMWQLVFEDIMDAEDYDYILKNGWNKFNDICVYDRLGYDRTEMKEDMEEGSRNKALFYHAGIPFMKGGAFPATFDALAFGRGIMEFFIDLYECPDKVEAVINLMLDEYIEANESRIAATIAAAEELGEKALYSVQSAVHANCNMVNRQTFERFAWPSYKRAADLVIKHGGYVHFHLDCCWTDFLDYFTDFPAGRCIFDTDGGTDLYKVRDILGSKMAFTGFIPPATMAFGTPDENYRFCKQQLEEMGDSYIVSPSCTFPANMPRENIEAFYAAVDEI